MNTGKWIIVVVIFTMVGIASGIAIDHFAIKSPIKPGDVIIIPGDENKPVPKKGKDSYACGDTIHIDGQIYKNETFRTFAYNDCMSNYRDFKINFNCPRPKWSIGMSALGGLASFPDVKKYDFIYGIDGYIVRYYGHAGIGGGLWFLRGTSTDFWAVGARITANVNWGKQ